MANRLGFGLLFFILVACGKQPGDVSDFQQQARLDELANRLVLNRGPALDPSPFGALVHLGRDSKPPLICTITHFPRREILSAAHCMEDPDPRNYRALFINKSDQKEVSKLRKFIQIDAHRDLALAELDRQSEQDWDSLPSFDVVKATELQRLGVFSINIWAFDPLKVENGMRFHLKHCLASLTAPTLSLTDYTGKSKRPEITMDGYVFMDNCSYPVIQGNSGALITLSGQWDRVVGVVSQIATSTREGERQFRHYDYIGLDGRSKRHAYKGGKVFFSIGGLLGDFGI